MRSLLTRRVLLTILGFVLFAVFVILAGPYFGFAGYEPLAPLWARLLCVATAIGAWFAVRVVKARRSKQASEKLVTAVLAQPAGTAETSRMRDAFEKAITQLKHRTRGRTLYDLPWYLVIGAPGAGKSTLLERSGLRFPLERTTGSAATDGVGGTRNCKWWFSDDAVLLDTAGRYTTQDSDPEADALEWTTFLGLLRKYRRRRPVNGVIFTLSAEDLLKLGPQARDLRISAARKRIDELNALGVQLPVYVMVTKCDLIAGFKEYFDDLPKEGRAQVWGVTFPYERTLDGTAVKSLPAEFDALVERLNQRVFARVEDERDIQRAGRVFGFPQQMAALRDSLSEFVSDVFSATIYERPILVRGVYFTSGTQEGNPIDRLLIAGLRDLGLHAQVAAMPASAGRAYFIERLLKDVILGESGLVGMNRRLEIQKAAAQLGAYAAIAAVGVLAVVALFWSFTRNRSLVADVADAVEKVQQVPAPAAGTPPDAFLPRLAAVRDVMRTANRHANDVPLAMRWGLYQGVALGNAARDAYVRELTGTLVADVADRFERRLADVSTPPEQLYEYLKGYLMLVEPGRLLPVQVAVLADTEWRLGYEHQPDIAAGLNDHLKVLLENPQLVPPISPDHRLVASARSSVRRVSLARLVYSRLQLQHSDDERVLHLDTEIGTGAEQTLRRGSVPLSTPIPAVYTKPVFREIAASQIGEVAKQFAGEQWVWGDAGQPPVATGTLSRDVIALYEDDYIAFWDSLLQDVQLVSAAGSSSVAELLMRVGGPNSPLRGFLQAVDAQTFLAPEPEPAGQGGRPEGGEKTSEVLGKVLGREGQAAVPGTYPGARITKHFEKLHDAVAKGAVDRALTSMESLGKKVASSDPGRVGGVVNPAEINEVVRELKAVVETLPPALGTIFEPALKGSTRTVRLEVEEALTSRYQEQVVRACREVVSGNYPFVRSSATEAPIADVARLFGPQGDFDRFFTANLEPFVDVSRSPWRWKEDVTGAELLGSRAMLRSVEAARRIRDVLFPPNAPGPSVAFNLTPDRLDDRVLRFVLDVDGQRIEYSHGPREPKRMSWPGQGAGIVSLVFDNGAAVRPTREFKGEWALFRLLDSAQVSTESITRYRVTFQLGGHQARFVLDALSVRNPFGMRELQQFRCEG